MIGAMTRLKDIYIVLFILYCFVIQKGETQIRTCNLNGQKYRDGETTVQLLDNNILFRCTCRVSNNVAQRNCSHSKEDAHVLIADVNGISKVLITDGFGFQTNYIRELTGIPVSIDVDYAADYIYWTDVSSRGKGIYRARYSDGGAAVRIISKDIFEPNGISIDWLSKNIYWTDAQLGAIFVAKNDGTKQTRLIGGLKEPRSILTLPREGLMFWSDQSAGTIERARMDGSNRRVVIVGLERPNELAVDYLNRRIYWIDGGTRRIESCDFDGYDYNRIYDFSYTFDAPAFGLSLFKDHLYFSVWNENSLYSITKIGQHFKRIAKNLGPRPMGISIINKKLQDHNRKTNPCWYRDTFGEHPCSHLCLPKSYNDFTCACPSNTGLVLSRDRRSCVVPRTFILYTSLDDGTIMIVSTEFGAPRIPSLLAQSHQPSAVAFDPIEKVVYWSDVAMNAIYRKPLNESASALFLQDGIGIVDGLCVDYVSRHLYFTNMGWDRPESPFHRIEMVDLMDVGKRKILTSEYLDKPRDIVIDQKERLLYVSDWGAHAKVVRFDLNGQFPQILRNLDVENPNGLALHNGILYITDSHAKSAFTNGNGTTVKGEAPKLIQYFTSRDQGFEMTGITMETPFGLTMNEGKIFYTDWGLGGIYEVDSDGVGGAKEFIIGIQKPTGILYGSLSVPIYENACTRERRCSDVCVPIDDVTYSCICPDGTGNVLSSDSNCVEPDEFILVADGNRIVMKSFEPADSQQYVVVSTYDTLSDIVALTYDPPTRYVYWADNGRQRISRQTLDAQNSGPENIEVIYSNIGRVDGMTLDPDHRLLYWTDQEKGTIEMLQLSSMMHSTVLTELLNPRAITLNPSLGIMYWTEWGDSPVLMSATMNGQDSREMLTTDLKWPNGLYFDEDSRTLFIADGGKLNIKSVPFIGDVSILDYYDENGTADHIYGIWKYKTSLLYSDWENRAVIKSGYYQSNVIMNDMIRPSQIFVQEMYQAQEIEDLCYQGNHRCSHICVPSTGSYVCLCPDYLTLAPDLRSCVTEERARLLTSTAAPTTTTQPLFATSSEAPWAEIIGTTMPIVIDDDVTTMAYDVTTDLLVIDLNVTEEIEEPQTTATIPATTTTTTAQPPTTTTLPGDPYFLQCNEVSLHVIYIPSNAAYVNITSSLVEDLAGLKAYDGLNRPLIITMIDDDNRTMQYVRAHSDTRHVITFRADDDYDRSIECAIIFEVKDSTPPFLVEPCPSDMHIETYSEIGEAFVTWLAPEFNDNSRVSPSMTNNYEPGSFSVGLYNVTYQAQDQAGNIALCSFQLAVTQAESKCLTPFPPVHGRLTCVTDPSDAEQKCRVSCDSEYHLSLADPYIKCITDENGESNWIPYLNKGICSKPTVSNVQQQVLLQYVCPCRPSATFYEKKLDDLSSSLKRQIQCSQQTHKLGLCFAKGKVTVDCIDYSKLKFAITVDLYSLRGFKSTKEVRQIVKRSATKILDIANHGDIEVYGSDNREATYNWTDNSLTLSRVSCISDRGYITTEDGCVACPKGTYWHENKCEFCEKDHYQHETGRDFCLRCLQNEGTSIYGATDVRYCKPKKQAESSSNVTLIAVGAVGGVLVVIAILLAIGFVHWRRRNNKFKKEQEKKKKEREIAAKNRRRHRSNRRRTRSRESGQSKNVDGNAGRKRSEESEESRRNERRRTKSRETISSSQTAASTSASGRVITEQPDRSKKIEDKRIQIASKSETEINVHPTEDNKSTGGESAIFTDVASDTASVVSSEPALKSALKKRKNPRPPESYLEDDTSTVISASTITSAQLKRANIKVRSSSLDQDVKRDPNKERGRTTARSISMRRSNGSTPNFKADGPAPLPVSAQSKNHHRSLSFDRGNAGPPRKYSPRFNIPVRPSNNPQPMLVRMPQGPRAPGGPPHSYMVGPRPGAIPIYGGCPPRMMPPVRPGMYHPNHIRHPYMGNRSGTLPVRPRQPYSGGYWNEGYDNPRDYMGNDANNRTMTLPRASMMPRYRIPNGGIPNVRPYQGGIPPPPYYA